VTEHDHPETIFTVTFRAPAGSTGIHALRALLKTALRRFGLRCTDIREEPAPAPTASNQISPRRSPPRPNHFRASHCRRRRQWKKCQRAEKENQHIMDMSRYAGSKYLKVADLKESGPFEARIVEVGIGDKFDKPEITLDDGSTLSCNATNCGRLIRAYGAESTDWIDKEIELYVGPIDFNGQPQEAILVKPISPPLETRAAVKPEVAKPQKRGSSRDDMDDTIPF
jgi:hypothetical protein